MKARRSEENEATEEASNRLEGIVGLMADIVEPAPGYENAVEAVLGEALQYILVKDQQAGTEAIDYLQTSGAGRSGFIPVSRIKPINSKSDSQLPPEQRLLSHVTVAEEFRPIAEALLGHVAVTSSLPDALSLFNRNGRIQSIVTRDGDVVSHQGILIGGSQNQLAGILSKKQELKELALQTEQIEKDLITSQAELEALEESVRGLETDLQQAISNRGNAVEDAMTAEKHLYRIGEDLKNAKRNQEILELEQEQLLGEESDLDEEMSKYNQALSRIESEVRQINDQTAENTRKISGVTSRLESYNQRVVDLKLELTALQAKLENGVNTLQRLKEFEQDSQVRLEQLKTDIAHKKEKHRNAISSGESHEVNLRRLYDELKQLEEVMASNETEYHTIDAELQESDEKQAAIQSEREKILEKMRLLELDLSEKRVRRDNIAAKASERYHTSIGDLRMQIAQEKEVQMSLTEMEKEVERLRSKISGIGDVNLGAIKEYEELNERFEFLSAQRDDLLKAIEDLHKVIRKINRITQERFMATYEEVNAKLKEVFPKLFEGGSARLELTDPGKPLETGVEYMVHPPGKKLTRMSLLSGGEKALSAIAFIFAIFLIRPTSFCLLDEIDAPLDEANVVRFNNLMQVIGEKSQIIMITHNKKSMEFAEMLFGVTMEQKGISKVVSVNLQGKAA